MAKFTSNFIFDLFMENTMPAIYQNPLENSFSPGVGLTVLRKPSENDLPDTFIIKNIPDYWKLKVSEVNQNFKKVELPLYKGYLMDLREYSNTEEFLIAQLSSRNRKNLRKKLRLLEAEGDISCQFYYGDMLREEYERLFRVLFEQLEKRFHEKKLFNIYLANWNYYYELVYPLILDKKASLLAIYDKKKPISIALNFHVGNLVYGLIHSYDTDYSHYNLGDISNLKHLDWFFKNDILVYDLLMGETYNKLKWTNHTYTLNIHLFYTPENMISYFVFRLHMVRLSIKRFLRNKGVINETIQLDRLYYYTKRRKINAKSWRG